MRYRDFFYISVNQNQESSIKAMLLSDRGELRKLNEQPCLEDCCQILFHLHDDIFVSYNHNKISNGDVV